MNWADYFYYDESSPSCLRWAVNVGSRARAGSPAGCFNECWAITLHSRKYKAHRIVWELLFGAIPPKFVIDHEDGNSRNNKRSNLRAITQAVNRRNSRRRHSSQVETQGVSTEGRKGVALYWVAYWTELDGTSKRIRFSIKKLGSNAAKAAAEQTRAEAIKRMNAQGAGYTERHGV